ncbi:MAG: hypothetical protein QM817_21325 [Archangium sp.]
MLTDPAVEAFEASKVDPQHFRHRDHLYVAWCYLRVMPLEEALARYVRFLRALVTSLGVPHKFHRTVTWRFVLLLERCMRETPGLGFDALLAAHPALTAKHDAWLDERGREHVAWP